VAGEEVLHLPGDIPGFLEVMEEGGPEVYRRPIAFGEREVVLDLEGLRPDRWYCWWLYSERVAGRLRLSRFGRLRPLSAADRDRLTAAGPVPSRYELLALGLHDDLLRDLAPALQSGAASLEDKTLARRLIHGAYRWFEQEAAASSEALSPQAEPYRDVAIWLESQILPGDPK
jgi:hypothetical protein